MRSLPVLALLALCTAGDAKPKTGAWAKDIPFTTDWPDAIKECRNTGKILFVYNGWERDKI